MLLKKITLAMIVLLMSACGRTGKEHHLFVEHVRNNRYVLAEHLTKKDDFYKDENSLLLRNFEMGSFHYLKGEYYQALQRFDKAQKLSKELYTKSILENVSASIAGDGLISYDGERYELSMLRFYQSLTHYRLYEQGFYEEHIAVIDDEEQTIPKKELSQAEKRKHLNGARASLLDWNALLTTYYKESKHKEEFHDDMLAKAWGAEVHNIYNTTNDKQIAKQLYKDMSKLLSTVYKDYDAYDETHKQALDSYANEKVKRISNPKNSAENVQVVLKVGFIEPKKAKKHDYQIPMEVLLASSSDSNFVSCLGLILPGQRISFEVLTVDKPKPLPNYTIEIFDEQKKSVIKKEMVLTSPLSETAYKEYERTKSAMLKKKTARLTSKYVSAAVTACAMYSSNNLSLMIGSIAAFAISTNLIKNSEYADVRYWGLLPNAVLQQSLSLKPAKYTVKILSDNKVIHKQDINVVNSDTILLDINLPLH